MSSAQPVAEAAHGLDQVAGRTELRAQPLHVHVDGARLDVGRGFPHRLEQVRARLHAAAPLGEREQQLVLGRRELDRRSVDVTRCAERSIAIGPMLSTSDAVVAADAPTRRRIAPTRSTSSCGLNGFVR